MPPPVSASTAALSAAPPAAPPDAVARIAALELALREATARAEQAEQLAYCLAPPLADGAAEPNPQLQAQELLHYLPAAVATHSAAGVLLSCNQAFALLLQRPAAQLVGQPLAAIVPPDEHQTGLPRYLAQFATRSAAQGVLPVLPRDGQPKQLFYHAHRLGRAGGGAHVLLCALDLTERVQAEALLRRDAAKAEASGRAKEAFLANLSHEIRTPMNGVLGMARQLGKSPLNPDQQELLSIIQTSGEHLLAVLNEVLDMTKISSARFELEQRSFDLRQSVEDALRPLAVQATEKGLTFHVAVRPPANVPSRVVGDAYRLNQVVINLVSNAIKFTPAPGSIAVAVVLVQPTDTHLTVLVRLTDTGIGIAADKLEHIFEDFVQADVDTARRYGGTGLGLGIARALVEQMGGTLGVSSQLGCGSTFEFAVTLPCAVGAPAAAPAVPVDTGALHGRRVLVAEDNGINREVVRRLLHGWGVVVDEAADGPAALALHAAHRYDAVLMDIQMPGMSGVEATAHLRRHPDPARAQVPVLALTANAFRADLDRYLRAGINDCLTKPFKEEEFYRKLVALLPPPAAPLYNLAEVYKMADGDAAFTQRLVRSFLQHVPPLVQQVQAAAAAGEWQQVATLVHHVRPNLVQFGVADVEPAMQLLMRPLRAGAKASPRRRSAVRHLVQQLEQVLAQLPQGPPPARP